MILLNSENLEEILNQKNSQKVQLKYFCKECNKEVFRDTKIENLKASFRKKGSNLLLCQSCYLQIINSLKSPEELEALKKARSEAQKKARESFTEEKKLKISKTLSEAQKASWENSTERKERLRERTRQHWANLTQEEKDSLKRNISEGVKAYEEPEEHRQLRLERTRQTWLTKSKEEKEAHSKAISLGVQTFLENNPDYKPSERLKSFWENLPEESKTEIYKKQTESKKVYYSKLTPDQKLKISEKLKQSWSNKTSEERKAIRRKSNKKNKYKLENGEVFDSLWELRYYEFCKSKGFNIIREPCELEYEYEGKLHHYYPDFEVNGQLVEVKSDFYMEGEKMINPFNRSLDGLAEAKHQCGILNGVQFLFKQDLLDLGVNLS